ncbi:MAG TPA: hypothetical protein VIO38_11950, partial [Rariglobus sp.]
MCRLLSLRDDEATVEVVGAIVAPLAEPAGEDAQVPYYPVIRDKWHQLVRRVEEKNPGADANDGRSVSEFLNDLWALAIEHE